VGSPHLWLLESVNSRVLSRIESASAEVGLSVARLDTIASAPANASLIGVGPSIADPLRVARQLRAAGARALLVFFAASSAARDALQAELLRDPFVYPSFEIVELSGNPRQLATRLDKVVSKVKRSLHVRPTTRRGRRQTTATNATTTSAPDALSAEAALRESNRQKDEFLAIMSHELRTPLTSILGYTDMLLRGLSGPLPPTATRYVTNVRSAGDRLLELVNSLLDFTRLESGGERLELRRLDLGRVIAGAVEMSRAAAESKGVDLAVAIEDGLDPIVEADEARVTHVVRNLLGNALKFTPGPGRVQVIVAPDAEQLDSVRVSVSDSGIGLREEQLERVWERFYQADASLTRPYGGVGLGLSIARHLVALHGGSVGAESAGAGRGSTFWFSLPRRQTT
jgi:signal transduction histidine kinase